MRISHTFPHRAIVTEPIDFSLEKDRSDAVRPKHQLWLAADSAALWLSLAKAITVLLALPGHALL